MVQNFMIKAAAIYLALYCSRNQRIADTGKGIGKICLASLGGTVLEIVVLMLLKSYGLFLFFVNIIELPLVFLWIVPNRQKSKWRLIFYGYFFTILINGVLEALWNYGKEKGGYLFYLVFSSGVIIVGVRIWKNYKREQKGIFRVELTHRGRHIKMNGLYDSGNHLKDPYTNKGVHIVSEYRFKELGLGEKEDEKVYIPYKSLGEEEGLLGVCYLDELIITGKEQEICMHNCPLGVTKDNLFEGKKYEMILNEEVF